MKIAIAFLLLVSTVSVFGQSDFTGNWKLNLDKTEFNETPGTPAAAKLVVDQMNVTLILQRNDRANETLKIDSTSSIEI